MSREFYTLKNLAQLVGNPQLETKIKTMINGGQLPPLTQFTSGIAKKKGYPAEEIPKVLSLVSEVPRLERACCFCVFTTKGGVLKSTLSLNLARWYALHNYKTLVIGLDIQGDITNALGHFDDIDEEGDLESLVEKLNQTQGLYDFFRGSSQIEELIAPTDLDTLSLIPETPELVALNESIAHMNRREYWLKDKIIAPLKEKYDIIILDCSPNWNKLTTNALVACDVLLGPIECKINNFRNFKIYRHMLQEFKQEMSLNFLNLFIPTKYSQRKKLSREIKQWYELHIENCLTNGVRESTVGEEACAMQKGFFEHAPSHASGKEMIKLMGQVAELSGEYLTKEINSRYTVDPQLGRRIDLFENNQGNRAWP